jgi:polyribonucleotide nucleotidyltransferase
LITKKPITTTWFERDDGATLEQRRELANAMRRKIEMAKKKTTAKKVSGEKKKVDRDKLKSLLEKGGKTAEELIKELGGVARLALKNAVLRVMNEQKKFYEVPGLFGKVPGNIKYQRRGCQPSSRREMNSLSRSRKIG